MRIPNRVPTPSFIHAQDSTKSEGMGVLPAGFKKHMILVNLGPDSVLMVSAMETDAVCGQRVLWAAARVCACEKGPSSGCEASQVCEASPGATYSTPPELSIGRMLVSEKVAFNHAKRIIRGIHQRMPAARAQSLTCIASKLKLAQLPSFPSRSGSMPQYST